MKQINCVAPAMQKLFASAKSFTATIVVFGLIFPLFSDAQAVSGIITDYKGFWKTSATNVNSVKPDNSHNLLSFTYNGTQYSTGVNDELLAFKGEQFVQGDFWSLPVEAITGSFSSNTKAGFGALYDGILNGSSLLPPEYGIASYLTDGIKGLNLGTCIANLPTGSMNFLISNLRATSIGDGIPDILVTQVADPSGSYDRYEFTDVNGVRVGNFKDIVFTNIAPIGNWTADFYEARVNPFSLIPGFTQTDRPIRLWAADLSEFGITQANYSQIRNFKINLSGNSDLAFVAYNNRSVNFQNALPVQYSYFKGSLVNNTVRLNWQTVSEQNADRFVIERSSDGVTFKSVGTVMAKNNSDVNDYSFTDAAPLPGKAYYRLRQVDIGGSFTNSSTVVRINNTNGGAAELNIYPNPARSHVYVEHAMADGTEVLSLYNVSGVAIKELRLSKNTVQTRLDLAGLPAGTYYVSFQGSANKISTRFVLN